MSNIPLLVLDDTHIRDHLLKKPDLVNAFPQLRPAIQAAIKQMSEKKGGCGSCGGGAKRIVMSDSFAEIRRTLHGMSEADRERFKQMVGATRIRMYYKDGAGHVVKATI